MLLEDLGNIGRSRPRDEKERAVLVEQAIRHQLVCLVDGLMIAALGAALEGHPIEVTAVERLLWTASTVVGEEGLFGARDPRELLRWILDDWREASSGTSRGRAPELDAWLAHCAGRLLEHLACSSSSEDGVARTQAVMAYVAAMAFFAATGTKPPAGLALDAENGAFRFPK